MPGKKSGKVYLVGAGPGDPSLITVRGRNLLEQADVIVVDDLVDPLLLQINAQAEIIYVGKRGPGAPNGSFLKLPQPGINRLLVKLARQGKKVVRLKGGDPLIFGRGGEEMEALRTGRVPFEVVPGVTSAISAPAYAGIPLSDRRWASSITFLTGQESQDPHLHTPGIEWDRLSPKGTLVIFMGVSRWKQIRDRLLTLGWPSRLSVAAIQGATTRHQRVLLTNLRDSARFFRNRNLTSPVIFIVGDVSNLSRRLSWVQQERPLLGRRVVVTRPDNQSRELRERLEEKGASVVPCPAIAIEPLLDDPHTLRVASQLKDGTLAYDWFVFLSENGAQAFHKLMGSGSEWRGRGKIMALGPHTRAALERGGWPVDRTASVFNSKGILASLGSVKGKRLLIPRVQKGPRDLIDALRQRGASVDEISTYRTVRAPAPSSRLKQLIINGVEAVTFTSASTVENFFHFFNPREIQKIFSQATAISIGPTTTAALRKKTIRKIVQARTATAESLVEALFK